MAPSHNVRTLELCRIAPPQGTTNETTLPLTFFDLLWITSPPVQHILFYHSPHFTPLNLLPLIKHSLSLTLRTFYPLAGHLNWPQQSSPTLDYALGDYVPLTIAESTHSFHHLVSNHAKESHLFHSLVPQLASSHTMSQVLALQLTLFPNFGFCIGFTLHHGIADGNTALQFLKTWSSLCKDGGGGGAAALFYDRSVIKDTKGLESIYLNDLRQFCKTFPVTPNSDPLIKTVRANFILTPTHINRLNKWLMQLVQKREMQEFYTSKYVLVCAYVMICLVKAKAMSTLDVNMKKTIQIAFPTGCRTRLDYSIPVTYFGNCIGVCCTQGMSCEVLKGEDGYVVAAEGIGSAIAKLAGDGGVLKGAEEWVKNSLVCDVSNERVMVAGTLKLNFYQIDFGWGKPVKSEVISLEKKGAFSLAECRDGDGGVEVGLALTHHHMECFSSLFLAGLKVLE